MEQETNLQQKHSHGDIMIPNTALSKCADLLTHGPLTDFVVVLRALLHAME